MKKNMGNTDRLLRLLFAVVVAVLYFTDTITGFIGAILGILAVVFLLTSVAGTCPLYMPFRFSTKKETKTSA
ncbi:MAG: membrane protein [Bacteroidia bacterium]|nr:MAG: membrane protein [Bacteroidia bacterium]